MPHTPVARSDLLDPSLQALAGVLLSATEEASGAEQLLFLVARRLTELGWTDSAALYAVHGGRWNAMARSGPAEPPERLLAEALDRERPCEDGPWAAAALSRAGGRNEVLALRRIDGPARPMIDQLAGLARHFDQALRLVGDRRTARRRIGRLEAILDIAAQWNRAHQMESLLRQMAETSCRLLGAERASIFLWDRTNHVLVGRPALGMADDELRIPDDAGIVGQVVQTGEPRRVGPGEGDEQIDRSVDEQTSFSTSSLLCVPLRGTSGELFGAFEMINKLEGSFTDDDETGLTELAHHAAIALENTQQHQQLLQSRKSAADAAAARVHLIGSSEAIEAIRSTAERVANTDLAILLLGENGTGKEVVAQLIHYLSRRHDEPFIAINCAALTETLLESELFGHEKGAFTDAHEARAGKFELASGGTLFLDEIGDLSTSGQAKLLRVLEEKVVVRVGGSVPRRSEARVIAATNQDLGAMVAERSFREDLFFRLNVVSLELPPLRMRGDDVLELAKYFLDEFCRQARRKPPRLAPAARRRLLEHAWPGNVRELRNLMERLAFLSTGDVIEEDDLAFILLPVAASPGLVSLELPLGEATREFQIDYINRQIEACHGSLTVVAQRLGMHRSNLYRKMRQLGITGDDAEE